MRLFCMSVPRPLRRLAVPAALFAWFLPVAGYPTADAPGELAEYSVKAAFLYHFAQFVEWPPDGARDNAAITIGVLGSDPFGEVLDKAVLGKTIGGRKLAVRRFATIDKIGHCDILFISSSEASHLPAVLAGLSGTAVLTVGEADRFARRGGMIGFFFEDSRMRLEVNVATTEAAGLRVSSKLLSVARLVKAGNDGAR